MKALAKWLVMGTFVALVAVVAAPSLLAESGDDVAGFYVSEQLRVGSTDLAPGIYVVRVVRSSSSRNVLLVTDGDGTKVFSALLATPHQIAQHEIAPVSRLLYAARDGSKPNTLRTFLVANSSFGYDIVSSGAATRVASRTGVITAIAALR